MLKFGDIVLMGSAHGVFLGYSKRSSFGLTFYDSLEIYTNWFDKGGYFLHYYKDNLICKNDFISNLRPKLIYFELRTTKHIKRKNINIENELNNFLIKLKLSTNISIPKYFTGEELKEQRKEYKQDLTNKYKVYLEAKTGDIFEDKYGRYYVYLGLKLLSRGKNNITYDMLSKSDTYVEMLKGGNLPFYSTIENFCNMIKVSHDDYSKYIKDGYMDYKNIKKRCNELDFI